MKLENQAKTIVISAINYFEGGPLTILMDCLSELASPKYQAFQIIVLVHKISLFESKTYPKNIVFQEFPSARKSYFIRLFYEFIYFKRLTTRIGKASFQRKPSLDNVYLWFSLHDISPNLRIVHI